MLRRLISVLVVLVPVGLLVAAPALAAEACPNEQIRAQEVYALRLPDCRAYEQVTPINKNGANPTGAPDFLQASPDGGRLNFLVLPGMPGAVGESEYPQFLAARGPTGWSSEGLLPPTKPGNQASIRGWSESLSQTAVELHGLELRTTASGAFQQVVPGQVASGGTYGFHVAAFSADESHLIFESPTQLLPNAAPNVINLYEWNASKPAGEQLSLAGVLPDGSTPPGGSFAGPYAWVAKTVARGGATSHYYTQNTISADGSRVFFTTGGTESQGAGQIYIREDGATTVQVSASQRSLPDPNGPKPAAFMAATPSGSQVFFTSCQQLTDDSTAVSTAAVECTSSKQGQDLYRYDVGSGVLTDLTSEALSDPSTAKATHGAAVQGVLGTSADGSYVYFVANGVLAPGASPGNCNGAMASTEPSACNLYLWHDGTVTFIARQDALSSLGLETSDSLNWQPTSTATNGVLVAKSSRVTPDGLILMFRSQERLTSYDNQPLEPGTCAMPFSFNLRPSCEEIYRYEAGSSHLACVSCDPSGAPPTGNATLQSIRTLTTAPENPASILTRNLSADGSRVFFESPDALVPQDTNGQRDVYEWEQGGSGSCHNQAGCLFLLSTGQSPDPAYFADASANGNDAFFFTSQPLVGQDQDQIVDIYDARVEGGLASQNPPPVTPCSGDGCRLSPSMPPVFGAPSSMTFSGNGNLTSVFNLAVKAKPKPLTRSEKLARALRACKRERRTKRAACVKRAEKRYGQTRPTTKRNRRGK